MWRQQKQYLQQNKMFTPHFILKYLRSHFHHEWRLDKPLRENEWQVTMKLLHQLTVTWILTAFNRAKSSLSVKINYAVFSRSLRLHFFNTLIMPEQPKCPRRFITSKEFQHRIGKMEAWPSGLCACKASPKKFELHVLFVCKGNLTTTLYSIWTLKAVQRIY